MSCYLWGSWSLSIFEPSNVSQIPPKLSFGGSSVRVDTIVTWHEPYRKSLVGFEDDNCKPKKISETRVQHPQGMGQDSQGILAEAGVCLCIIFAAGHGCKSRLYSVSKMLMMKGLYNFDTALVIKRSIWGWKLRNLLLSMSPVRLSKFFSFDLRIAVSWKFVLGK